MLSHEEMIGLQAEKHDLIDARDFRSKEEYVLHLMHTFAYDYASRLAKDRKVLDLGCNTGYGGEILYRSAKTVVGVDVSESAVSAAKREYGHLGIVFQLIDGKRLPFEDNEFDMIVSCQVIEHVVDYDLYIGELKRVLSPNGIVIFTTPNALLRLDPGMKPWNKFHVREFSSIELESLLKTFFSEVRVSGLFAKEPLYSIEANRVDRLRKNARHRNSRGHSFRSLIKAALPDSLVKILKKDMESSSNITPDVDKKFIEEHDSTDFFYRTNDLDTALDLVAICSEDEGNLRDL